MQKSLLGRLVVSGDERVQGKTLGELPGDSDGVDHAPLAMRRMDVHSGDGDDGEVGGERFTVDFDGCRRRRACSRRRRASFFKSR